MFSSILERLGLARKGKTVATVRLEVVEEQVRQFNEAKAHINEKISTLEERTEELDSAVHQTLDISKDNQARLDNIEASLERIISLSEAALASRHPRVKPAGEASETEQ